MRFDPFVAQLLEVQSLADIASLVAVDGGSVEHVSE